MTQQQSETALVGVPGESFEAFEERLVRALGATVGGHALTRALGYPSQEAFRKAFQRDRVPVVTFEIKGRRGRFAATTDIADWLWAQRGTQTRRTTTAGGAT